MSVRYAVWETLAAELLDKHTYTAALDALTADGETCRCAADYRKQNGYSWVLKGEAWEREGGNVARHSGDG